MKLDFPRFNGGEDPSSWLCPADQFFQSHDTPAAEQVTLASFYLEGDAQLWYQLLKQEMDFISWDEFKERLHTRFGPNQFLDFFLILLNYNIQGLWRSIKVHLRSC